jgi:hypothetical protein
LKSIVHEAETILIAFDRCSPIFGFSFWKIMEGDLIFPFCHERSSFQIS